MRFFPTVSVVGGIAISPQPEGWALSRMSLLLKTKAKNRIDLLHPVRVVPTTQECAALSPLEAPGIGSSRLESARSLTARASAWKGERYQSCWRRGKAVEWRDELVLVAIVVGHVFPSFFYGWACGALRGKALRAECMAMGQALGRQ